MYRTAKILRRPLLFGK